MIKYFEFESEIEKIEILLSQLNNNKELNIHKIKKLNKEKDELYKRIYSNLDPWQKVQVSRHGERPHTIDYIENIFDDIVYLHGDKKYADDNAIVGGLAKIEDNSVFFPNFMKSFVQSIKSSTFAVICCFRTVEVFWIIIRLKRTCTKTCATSADIFYWKHKASTESIVKS